ncbi:hypothetical protein CHCC20441_2868 [Bacillus licheniformis]|uniref:Uncharacterized protein n=1 Tax=Bacillus licheniformis TaxID=1402 RepID=A0A8B5Y9Q8_BACLI|nr:hypothetical protein MUY_000718 [Bacillus licheniformis WX-02]KYC68179.1 hypothetical protein B4092_0744 [Bacillus licheniformis]TWN09120.1 hypothetical protein CHCC14564_4355 [Bacillus licheniformis LMG 17339]KYC74420.1 hypothetical protein B4090_0981 [Bacillus licheniformis]KYC82829.1 hypothetical protein B4091_0654 [Bacillus licheniformis]
MNKGFFVSTANIICINHFFTAAPAGACGKHSDGRPDMIEGAECR